MGSGRIRRKLKESFRYGSCMRKKQYSTESAARASAEARSKQTGSVLRAYLCVFCKGWHIGSPREWEQEMNAPQLRAKIQQLCDERNVLRMENQEMQRNRDYLQREIKRLEKALAAAPAEVCEMCGEELLRRMATPSERFIPAEEVFRKYGIET